MKRLAPAKIDNAQYYEDIWSNGKHYFDTVRLEFLIEPVAPGHKVVDLGAGVFGAVQYICERKKIQDVQLVAYDQSYTAASIVTQTCPGMTYYVDDMLPRTPFNDGEFDVVMAGEVIEHMEDPGALVTEMARICKPGGWLTMTTVDTICAAAIAHGPYPEHLWEFTPDDLVEMFLPWGRTEYRLVGNYHGILCQRGRA